MGPIELKYKMNCHKPFCEARSVGSNRGSPACNVSTGSTGKLSVVYGRRCSSKSRFRYIRYMSMFVGTNLLVAALQKQTVYHLSITLFYYWVTAVIELINLRFFSVVNLEIILFALSYVCYHIHIPVHNMNNSKI